jgi:hypothetical protein
MTLRAGVRTVAWSAWASVGYPLVIFLTMWAMVNSQLGLAFMNALDSRWAGSAIGYALLGVPAMIVLCLLGMLAGWLRAPTGLRVLGLIWAAVFFVVTAILMGFFMPGEVTPVEGLLSSALQSEMWALAGLGWWAGIRMLRQSTVDGLEDAVPRLGALGWILIAAVGVAGLLGLAGYLMASFR